MNMILNAARNMNKLPRNTNYTLYKAFFPMEMYLGHPSVQLSWQDRFGANLGNFGPFWQILCPKGLVYKTDSIMPRGTSYNPIYPLMVIWNTLGPPKPSKVVNCCRFFAIFGQFSTIFDQFFTKGLLTPQNRCNNALSMPVLTIPNQS